MLNLIKKLFTENKFTFNEAYDFPSEVVVFTQEDNSCFISASYFEDELINFFSSNKTKHVINAHKESAKLNPSFKKNTSLLIFIQTSDIKSTTKKLKNTILNIEEDEYFFRKYVLLYNKEMICEFGDKNNLTQSLQNTIKNGDIDKLRENNFYDPKYYFAMQLFIKIPWLNYETTRENFELLEAQLKKVLVREKLHRLDTFLDNIDDQVVDELLELIRENSDKPSDEQFVKLIEPFESAIS